jgi:Zn ribbon nucleic-acid-binding protein
MPQQVATFFPAPPNEFGDGALLWRANELICLDAVWKSWQTMVMLPLDFWSSGMRISERNSTATLCPACGGATALSHFELEIPYYRRVFKCVACGYCDRVTVKPLSFRGLAASGERGIGTRSWNGST